jgi:predicted  nucleic acid-binding Zn-ribbon protein
MSYHCFSRKNVKANKQHQCIWCGQAIDKGAEYVRENSIYCGNWQDFPWHTECDAYARNEVFAFGDREFMAGSNERPTLAQAYQADDVLCDMTM